MLPAADRGRGQRAAFARTRRMRTGGRKNAFPVALGAIVFPRPLPVHSGNLRPAPTPDSATRAGRTRTAANPLPANRAKIAPGRAGNVRGDNPPPEPVGRILPPKNPPHLTD